MNPQLTMYHASAKCTGSALELSLHPAIDGRGGYIKARIANQKTIGDRLCNPPTFPTFDWDNAIEVKLEFDDLTKMLQVFRGECEQVDDGKGLYHANAKRSQQICLRHMIEPCSAYSFEVYENSRDFKEEKHARFLLSPSEALGLSVAIESAFCAIVFGFPIAVES